MIITYKEFKKKVQAYAAVYLGSFRQDEADERRGREVSIVRSGYKEKNDFFVASSFFNLPLTDSYKLDIYSDYRCHEWKDYGWNDYYVNEKSSVNFNACILFIIAPTLAQDVEKAYKRMNGYKHCRINPYVLTSASEACAAWMRRSNYLKGKNEVRLLEGLVVLDACEKDAEKHVKAVRRTLEFAEKAFTKFLSKEGFANEGEYMDHLKQEAKDKAAAKRSEKAAEKKRKSDIEYVISVPCA